MKNIMAAAFAAALAVSTGVISQPTLADELDTSAKNARRAEHQENKAQRDAAEGNVAGAERHAENAARDAHKSRHEERRAIRKGE
jgi:uncharacterized protein HemY